MNKKLTKRGRQTELPIVGDTLVEVCLGICRSPALIFKAEDDSEAEITIEDRITLRINEEVQLLDGSKPGATFNPKALVPLVDLLGCQVMDAVATPEGELRITFTNRQVLAIEPSHGYEAWHFRFPRPGRPIAGNHKNQVALTGAHGRLI